MNEYTLTNQTKRIGTALAFMLYMNLPQLLTNTQRSLT